MAIPFQETVVALLARLKEATNAWVELRKPRIPVLKFAETASVSVQLAVMMETLSAKMGKPYLNKLANLTDINDRCSQNCQVELGYQCSGGSPYSKDTCTQICGDGRIMNTRPSSNYCDDGNLRNGDGCDSTCTVETGFTCSGGTSTLRDTCYEICGDGRNFGFLECDDGNNIDGDG
jgi:cysteine-rich repeat protein